MTKRPELFADLDYKNNSVLLKVSESGDDSSFKYLRHV